MLSFLISPTHKGTQVNLGGNGYVYYLDCGHAFTAGCMYMSKLCTLNPIHITIKLYALNMLSFSYINLP